MDNEEYIDIADGLSVGTMKIANKYEIFTEEEVDIINNKIPELDERVTIIEYEIEDINSSLDNKANKNEVFIKEQGININDFDEATKQTFLNAQGINVNYVLGEGNVTPFNTSFLLPNGAVDYLINKKPYRANSNFSKDGFWEDNNYSIFQASVQPNTTYIISRHDYTSATIDSVINTNVIKLMYSTVPNFDDGMSTSVIGSVTSANATHFTTPNECKYIYFMIANNNLNDNIILTLQKGTTAKYPIATSYELQDNITIKKIDELNNSIEEINSTIENLGKISIGKLWCPFGDSLTDVNGTATKKYWKWISDELGIDTHVMGHSGSGYYQSNNEGKAWYQRANEIPTNVDVITLFGSGNDSSFCQKLQSGKGSLGNWNDQWSDQWSDSDLNLFATDRTDISYCALVNHTIDNILKRNPFVKIGIITPSPWKDGQPNESYTPIMKRISDALIEIAERRGIPYLDLYRCSQLRPNDEYFRNNVFFNGDGVHPNNFGHEKYLYPQIREFLKKLI